LPLQPPLFPYTTLFRSESDGEQPEVPLPETLAQHPAGRLGEPVVEGREDREDQAADQDEVEVRDDEIRIGELPVERRDREHDPGQARAEELEQEGAAEEHRRSEAQ